jgi:uncharacterized membrane protein
MRKIFSINGLLWVGQSFLALFFILASGAPKLVLPAEALPMPIPLPQAFVWFIGTAEVLGGLGLILPGLTRVQPRLTTIAAVCLVALTLCAATLQLLANQPANAIFALAIGLLAAGVAYGRTRVPLAPGSMAPATASRPVLPEAGRPA